MLPGRQSTLKVRSPSPDCRRSLTCVNNYFAAGFSQRSPAKRPKSASHETSVAPCAIASEARWASVVRFPEAPLSSSKARSIRQCSSVSWTIRVTGLESHISTRSMVSSTERGFAKMPSSVARRINPSRTPQLRPTGSSPDKARSHHSLSRMCRSASRLTAYRSTFRSTIFTCAPPVFERFPHFPAPRRFEAPCRDSPAAPPLQRFFPDRASPFEFFLRGPPGEHG